MQLPLTLTLQSPNPCFCDRQTDRQTDRHTDTQLKHVRDTGQQVGPGVKHLSDVMWMWFANDKKQRRHASVQQFKHVCKDDKKELQHLWVPTERISAWQCHAVLWHFVNMVTQTNNWHTICSIANRNQLASQTLHHTSPCQIQSNRMAKSWV